MKLRLSNSQTLSPCLENANLNYSSQRGEQMAGTLDVTKNGELVPHRHATGLMSFRLCLAVTALSTIASFCPKGFAATWGSIRGNNRSTPHVEGRGAPRAMPPPPGPGRVIEGPRNREGEHEAGIPREPRREFEANRRAEFERETRERRHLDIDADRRHAFFWDRFHPGMIISALPPGYAPIYVGSTPYYYDEGVFYESAPSGYTVVTPPIGALVPVLPPGAEAIVVGPTVYYYAAGAFYLQQPQGYVVVRPPLGISVTDLPPDAAPVVINGVQYYQADGAYFLPMFQGGVTVYTTVQP